MLSRRSLFAMAALPAAFAPAQTQTQPGTADAAGTLFSDPDFGSTAQILLGASYYGGSDPGRLLAVLAQIRPGDFESAFLAFHQAGLEAQRLAEQARSRKHPVSAREAYLWASNYFYAALRLLDGTPDPGRMPSCWRPRAGPPRRPFSIHPPNAWRSLMGMPP